MPEEKNKLEEIIKLGNLMTQIKDVDILMERILTEARALVNADAGSIYKYDEGMLHFTYTQNATQQSKLPAGKKLVYNTFSMPINRSSIAGYVADTGEVLNIEDAYRIDEKYPFRFNKEIDLQTNYKTTSMLTVPLITSSGNIVGVLQLLNALNNEGRAVPFRTSDIPLIKHFANNAAVALERAGMTRAIILRMIRMAELRDPKETGAHVNRVGAFSAELYEAWAKKHQIPEKEMHYNKDLLRISAMLHDVGKVATPDSILKKPGKLTDEEFVIMKQHPLTGAQLFSDKQSDMDMMSQEIALNHHERWDGFGYPGKIDIETGLPLPGCEKGNGQACGKKGEETPLWARIVAVTDVYDALSCRRSYKEPWTQDDVLTELQRCSGSQFDPELIELFIGITDIIQSIRKKYPDED
jgi:HD-GYP domain-containing protein (c-di-GMP phosphodiesterase class II)